MATNPLDRLRRLPVKLFEYRDRATLIPMMAVRLLSCNHGENDILEWAEGTYADRARERWLLRRAGYAQEQIEEPTAEPYILLTMLTDNTINYDPYSWGNQRVAQLHMHIIKNWDTLKSGDVLDLEFILGESKAPKQSEQATVG
jgi:hypothetical protein